MVDVIECLGRMYLENECCLLFVIVESWSSLVFFVVEFVLILNKINFVGFMGIKKYFFV